MDGSAWECVESSAGSGGTGGTCSVFRGKKGEGVEVAGVNGDEGFSVVADEVADAEAAPGLLWLEISQTSESAAVSPCKEMGLGGSGVL